jgi:hypothetical protein
MMTLVVFPSSSDDSRPSADVEDRIARLTDAAYQVVLQQGLTGSFLEVQLGIWSAIRGIIEAEPSVQEYELENRREHRRVPARIAGKG